MLSQIIIILCIIAFVYHMDPEPESKLYTKLAAGAAMVFLPVSNFFQKYKSKKENKILFKEIDKLVGLIKLQKTEEFKEQCRMLGFEFLHKKRSHGYYTLLIVWASYKGYEEARFLVDEMGFEVNEQAKNGETPLIRATHFSDIRMVEQLIDMGANFDARTQQDMSALLTAITRNKPKIVDLLLKRGWKIDLKTENTVSLLLKLILISIFLS